jgi:hypothetical protein
MTEDNQLINLITGFTSGGTPLQATVGSKSEWMVTILTASMLANETLAASMVPEEMVDAAINYMNVIQERLSYYEGAKLHSLERLLNN